MPGPRLSSRQTVLLPDVDPFYAAPAGLSSAKPGDILRSRPVPYPIAAFNTAVVNLKGAYQILYRTTDSNGQPEAAMTTLLIPYNANPAKLLSYQIAEDAAYSGCAPSFILQKSSTPNATVSQAEIILIEAALNNGWYVVTPDYEGPKSSYVAGIQAGQATLDSIRAVLKSSSFSGISVKPKVALWGYSGGALATNWAIELQGSYAPELSFVGAAIGGLIGSIENVLETINKGPFVGLAATGLMGLYNEYPYFATYLEEQFIPATAETFKSVLRQCLGVSTSQFSGQDIFSYFKSGAAVLDGAPAQKVFGALNLGQNVPKMPLYIYKSINDQISPIADADNLVNYYCKGGAAVEYKRDLVSDHTSLAITGAGEALVWLEARMSGQSPESGCSTDTVISTLLNPEGLALLGTTLVECLIALLGVPVGPLSLGTLG
ncbi:hypothetical protein VE03_09271 [Pseudogymnoascus sp. 23342-1-I1]|nr:hypothetical protein VE03_09271 [Pseudogymnoascus sp. 23342-1-I1]